MQTAGLLELLEGDRLGDVKAALIDPALDAVDVDRTHHFGESRLVLAPCCAAWERLMHWVGAQQKGAKAYHWCAWPLEPHESRFGLLRILNSVF